MGRLHIRAKSPPSAYEQDCLWFKQVFTVFHKDHTKHWRWKDTQHLHIRGVWLRSACIIYTSCLVTDKESKRMQSWCHWLLLQLLTVPRLPLYPSCGAVSTYSSTVCSPLSKSSLALKRLREILLKTLMQLMTFSTYKNAPTSDLTGWFKVST